MNPARRGLPRDGWVAPATAVATVVGLLAGAAASPSPLFAFLPLLLGGLCFSRHRRGASATSVALALVAALLALTANHRLSAARAEFETLLASGGEVARVEFVVRSFPTVRPDGVLVVDGRVARIDETPVPSNRSRLNLRGRNADRHRDLLPGDRLAAMGRVSTWRTSADVRHLGPPLLRVDVKSDLLANLTEARSGPVGLLGSLNRSLFDRLERLAPVGTEARPAAELVAAMFLGRAGAVEPELKLVFRRSGLAHLLAISGLHIALLVGLVDGLGRFLGWSRVARLTAGFLLAGTFVGFAGARPSLVRAAGFGMLYLLARWLERPPSGLVLLATLFVLELVFQPADLFDVGFQLTYMAVAAIVLVAPWLDDRLGRLPRPIRLPVVTTIAAELGVAPLVIAHFGALPLFGVVANVLFVPLILAAALSGLVGFAVAHVDLESGRAALEGASWLIEAVEVGLRSIAVNPFAVLHPTRVVGVLVGSGAIMLIVAASARGRLGLAVRAVAVAALGAGFAVSPPGPGVGELRVAALDVGQGDAIVVRSAASTLLVDGGGRTDVGALPFADRVLLPRLARLGVTSINVVVLSHPHPDHCLGLLGLLEVHRVGEVWLPRVAPATGWCVSGLVDRAQNQGASVRWLEGGDRRTVGDLDVVIWSPDSGLAVGDDPTNDASLVLEVRHRAGTVLLPGDLERFGEARLLAAEIGPVDLLKVPHHGSRTSSSAAFLERVDPRVALLSCGRRNPHGHPVPEVVERYRERGVPLLRTDRWGTVEVVFAVDGPSRLSAELD